MKLISTTIALLAAATHLAAVEIPAGGLEMKDWTILKRGEVLEEWLGKRWRTEVTLTTDATGRVQWRGFPGSYELKLSAKPQPAAEFSVKMAKPEAAVTLPNP